MIATLKLRLKPTREQENKFYKFAHTARWAYNWGLATKKEYYEFYYETLKLQDLLELLQTLKHENKDYEWIKETPEAALKQSIKDLLVAYKNFFKGTAKFPKFKSRKHIVLSFYQRTDKLKYWEEESKVTITGVGRVKVINNYGWFPENPQNPRIKFDGKHWYLTVACEVGDNPIEKSNLSIGVDLGIKKLAVRSDGVEVININKTKEVKKLEKRMKRLQRCVSRKYANQKQQGGENRFDKTKNIIKVEKKIKLLHRRLKNIRDNHIHTATADIVKTKPYRVVVEDLNIKGMLKNRHLSKAVKDQCLNKFITYLEYKCEYLGIEFIKAGRFFPSSKLCSCCGSKKEKLSLSERTYTCDNCGNSLDRDLNASINLANYKVV